MSFLETKPSSETLAFITANRQKKPSEVALMLSKQPELPKEFILNQINGFQKASKKLPFLTDFPNYIFPDSRAVAQSSSESTANYKAALIEGHKMLDASGGMGIDSYFFSKRVTKLSYLEPNPALFTLTNKNFEVLGVENIECFQLEAQAFLKETTAEFDWIYIDPDRRKNATRFFQIGDCCPNVLELMDLLWERSNKVMLKFSPMLDLSLALEQLPFCREAHVVAVDNECKELLFALEMDYFGEATINAINIQTVAPSKLSFKVSEEQGQEVSFSKPLNFLYEANAAILKAGGFKVLATRFGLKKLAPNTHLYTSEALIENFPGRVLKIEQVSKPKKGLVKKANVVCRNFPLKPEELKKKYKITDGGNQFLYACTLLDKERVFILAQKLN